MTAGLPLSLVAVFVAAAGAVWLTGRSGPGAGWLLATVPLAIFAWLALRAGDVASGALSFAVDWIPSLGVRAAFALDGLSLVFALLITGIGALVLVYAGGYLAGHPARARFFAILLVFMGAMLGVVLADDLMVLFIFWELTGIASYLLIGFDHEKSGSRAAALQALLVTGGGGLALLVGLLLLGDAAGTTQLSVLLERGELVRADPRYPAILALVLLGAFTKSAQWPFHFWLPNAMAAPTPVSAYLHSATMVKAGIYLLARLDPVLGGTELWVWAVTPVGAVTMLLGAVLALRETDLKRVLAYSTLTALGTLVALLGLSFPDAVKAAIVFLVVHSLYKAGLFLVAGSVDHAVHTRDVRRLSGLRATMPWTALAAVLSGLSMAGLPPLFGFVAKELTYKAKLGFAGGEIVLPLVAVAANALTVVAAGIVAVRPFIGRPNPACARAREAKPALLVGPLLLGAAGLGLGLAPTLAADWLVRPATRAVLGRPMEVDLALWYGWNAALALSVATVLSGVGLYRLRHRIRAGLERASAAVRVGPEAVYEWVVAAIEPFARAHTRAIMAGGLSRHLALILAAAAVLLWMALAPVFPVAFPVPRVEWLAWALAAIVALEALGAVVAGSRLAGAAALGAMGFGVALLFLLAGAPDLATTQFLVETLIVVVLVVILRRLPPLPAPSASPVRKVTAGGIALALGAGFTVLLLSVLERPLDPALSDFFAAAAVPDGKGRNIVNVILVDFRALDTLGEIAVLGIAALGVLVLMGRQVVPGYEATPGFGGAGTGTNGRSPILRAVSGLLVPLLVLFSWYLLWRGHNEPGGGFIAGLVAVGALAVHVQAAGAPAARRLLRIRPQVVLAVGLGIALASGLVATTLGQPFMAGQWLELDLPAGPVKLGTPLLFDVGVYALVLGFGASVLLTLEERNV